MILRFIAYALIMKANKKDITDHMAELARQDEAGEADISNEGLVEMGVRFGKTFESRTRKSTIMAWMGF